MPLKVATFRPLLSKTLILKVMEKGIAKAVAEKDVLVNIDIPDAPTEWHKKAVKAQTEELEAIIEEANLRLENAEKQDEDGSSGATESKKNSGSNYL